MVSSSWISSGQRRFDSTATANTSCTAASNRNTATTWPLARSTTQRTSGAESVGPARARRRPPGRLRSVIDGPGDLDLERRVIQRRGDDDGDASRVGEPTGPALEDVDADELVGPGLLEGQE
jgi:hypothetical protein